jgi:hypothetical protein
VSLRFAFGLLLPAFLLILVPTSSFTQTLTTGDISGLVQDVSGAIVPGATVTVKSADTGEMRTAQSNDVGMYRLSLLKPGEYTISAQTGALKSNTSKFVVAVGQQQNLNLSLTVQGTQETVEIRAEAPVLQTENANNTTSVSLQQVLNLPMNGGDLTTIAFTVPGVRMNVGGGTATSTSMASR